MKKGKKLGKGKGTPGLAPVNPLPEIQEKIEAPRTTPKMTTAADVKIQTQIAKQNKLKAEKPEFNAKYKIWARYAKHPQLRPVLDKELGNKYFSQTPRNLEELNFRLGEIRSVFASANVGPMVDNSLLFAANTIERLCPPEVANLDGLTANVYAAMPELSQIRAEAECEYGNWFEAGLASRLGMTLLHIGKLTKDRNDALDSSPQPPPPQEETVTPPPAKKRKQQQQV